MAGFDIMDAVNRTAYSSPFALQAYSGDSDLTTAERTILELLKPRIEGRRLLDIGVGGGRTTRALLRYSDDYTAIDYSEVLTELARAKFGLDSVYCCDVRNMRRFADQSFDFAFFSFNGLDYIAHSSRLEALAEINRVLRTDGIFLFSSHNREARKRRRSSPPGAVARSLFKGLTRSLKQIVYAPRHWRMARYQTETAEYAIANDSGLRYSLLTYYIAARDQVAQLERSGFALEGVYDVLGRLVEHDASSSWLHYVATKQAAYQRERPEPSEGGVVGRSVSSCDVRASRT
jgi:SAM-dependent methyltransferase